jgi:hypothetical protein
VAGIGLLAGCGIPFGSTAQPTRLHKIGMLAAGGPEATGPNAAAFRQGLSQLGYIEGRDVVIEAGAGLLARCGRVGGSRA